MEGLYVTARVGERLKKYIVDSYQSDIIPTERNMALISLIKPHLELTADEKEPLDEETVLKEVVRIEIPLGNTKVYNHSERKVYVCNTIWRNRLSNRGQDEVRRFFKNAFKKQFRAFMDGFIECQEMFGNADCKYNKVKEGVTAFLMQYHIDFTERDIAALTRDWYRHRDKTEEYKTSPLVY